MKRTKMNANQRGIVSLLSAAFAAILFSIVVTSIVLIVANEAHQATNADLSNRAYYAAQAGVEEGIYKIKQALATVDPACSRICQLAKIEDHCIASTGFGANLDYSCLYMSRKSNVFEGELKKDETPLQLNLTNLTGPFSVEIAWNNAQDTSLTPAGLASLPAAFALGANWGANPAVLQVSTVRFKPDHVTQLFDPTDINQLEVVRNTLVPSNSPAVPMNNYDNTAMRNKPYYSNCTAVAVDGYNCKQLIRFGIGTDVGYKHVLVLAAKYNGTHYRVRLLDSSGSPISNVPNQFETIDVTAKSGNVYRRVRSEVAVYQGTAALDYSIFSDRDVCKDFQLRDSRTGTAGANIGACPF